MVALGGEHMLGRTAQACPQPAQTTWTSAEDARGDLPAAAAAAAVVAAAVADVIVRRPCVVDVLLRGERDE